MAYNLNLIEAVFHCPKWRKCFAVSQKLLGSAVGGAICTCTVANLASGNRSIGHEAKCHYCPPRVSSTLLPSVALSYAAIIFSEQLDNFGQSSDVCFPAVEQKQQ